MAITTLAQLNAAARQRVRYFKTAGPTLVVGSYHSFFAQATDPPAGTLAIGNTTSGVVPTDATTGYPVINAFGAGNTGYVAGVEVATGVGSVALHSFAFYDCLFSAGAFSFNANTTLSGQPSYSARVPSADYSGIEIWLEQVTAGTGAQVVTVGYTNQSGTTGRSTGAVTTATNIVSRMHRLQLQAGDNGVQSIQTVVGATATAGTFNIHVMRPLFRYSSKATGITTPATNMDVFGPEITALPVIYDTSALRMVQLAGETTARVPLDFWLDIVDG
jgi:hypothetical protein